MVGYQWSWGFNYIENVDGDASTGTGVPEELGAIPDKFQKQFPQGAEGVYDAGHPGHAGPGDEEPRPDAGPAQAARRSGSS